ncbi:MAG TPA: PQQ-binding-like beta-propeller repeat protein, partial [Thermoguttaceae bacterium]
MSYQTVICCAVFFLLIMPGTAATAEISGKTNAAEPAGTLTSSPDTWPLLRGDAQATGVAKSPLPEKLELLWRFSIQKDGFESTAAIVDGTVFIGCTDGNLYAIDLASGNQRWAYKTDSDFRASPGVFLGRVFIGDVNGRFYCVDAASGKLQWNYDTNAEIDSSPNFHDDYVIFGSQDAMLYCLDIATGKLAWKYESADQIRCFSTILDNQCFVAGCDGHLHSIDLDTGKGT